MVNWFVSETGAQVAAYTSLVLSVALAALALPEPRWNRRFAQVASQSQSLRTLINRHYARRPSRELYDLVLPLSLRSPQSTQVRRLASRVDLVLNLQSPMADDARRLGNEWLETAALFAQECSRSSLRDLRPFLQTYHLSLIRESAIALPLAIATATHDPDDLERCERIAWGWVLLELAVRYHHTNRIHRSSVYFHIAGVDRPVGPVLRRIGRSRRWALVVRYLFARRFVVSRRRQRAALSRVRRVIQMHDGNVREFS